MLRRKHGNGHVMSHGAGRLHPVLRHRQDLIFYILIAVAEDLVKLLAHFPRVDRDLLVRNGKLREMDQMSVQPFAVRMASRIIFLALLVGNDPLLLRIHKEQFSGFEPRLFDDMLRIDIENADLRGEDQLPVVRHIVSGRSQAVPVQRRTDDISVCENDRCRTVPRLHHRRVIVVEVLLLLRHETVVLPRLRNRHHHGERKVHTVHVHEFQRVVEHRRIRPRRRDDRVDLINVVMKDRRLHGLLAGEHAVYVAADRVDLPVVGDHSVWMRTVPGRRRVRRKTGMHDSDGSPIVRILQVGVESPQLAHEEHALIYDRPRGQRTDIGVLGALLKFPPDNVQAAVKVDPLREGSRPADKALPDAGHAVLRRLSENFRAHRHIAPSEEGQTFLCRDDLQHAHRKGALHRILRQEEHADAVVSRCPDGDAALLRGFLKEIM